MPALRRTLFTTAGASLLAAASAQDVLHYKFDGGCGGTAINYAAGSPAPATGSVVTNLGPGSATSWTTGRFGHALARASAGLTFNCVETGWAPVNVTGGISWACWLQMPASSPQSVNGLFGGVSAGCFQAGPVLFTTGWGGTSQFDATNLMALARAGWTHVASVVDLGARRTTYYLNGIAQTPVGNTGSMNWSAASVQIGRFTSLMNTAYDIDEFILANRVMSAAEIAVLAADPRAADAPFGASAGPTLAGNGQLPVPGNQSYGLVLNANVGIGMAVFGGNHCSLAGTIPLPADLGQLHSAFTGLQCHVDADLGSMFMGLSPGSRPLPLPLPNLAGLSGYSLFAQVLTFDTSVNRFLGSNAMAIGIGR